MARRTTKKAPNLTTTDDGLLLREVGDWSTEKLHYVARYMDIFTTSMREKWVLAYADLFAGPGKSRIRDTGEVIKGSPLLALDLAYRFNKYVFVEADSELLKTLEERIAPYRDKVEIKSKEADCNAAAKTIVSLIPSDSLALAFIDPEGCDIHFATIKALAASRRVDLLMTFPMGMDVKRNVDEAARYGGQDWTKYDYFFGSTTWRQTYLNALSSRGWKFAIQKTMEFYKNQLKQLGYIQVETSDEIVIKSTRPNVPLYYLLFASKHPRGKDFWKKISARTPTGQPSFNFES